MMLPRTNARLATDAILVATRGAEGEGGGRTLQNFVLGGSDPRSNHLLSNAFINMSFLQKKYSFCIPFKNYLYFKI